MVDWLFRNRGTGGITVAQVPNVSLCIFLVATALRLIVRPAGAVLTVLDVVAELSLAFWAVDELARGVNPFRRLLGAAVLALEAVALLR